MHVSYSIKAVSILNGSLGRIVHQVLLHLIRFVCFYEFGHISIPTEHTVLCVKDIMTCSKDLMCHKLSFLNNQTPLYYLASAHVTVIVNIWHLCEHVRYNYCFIWIVKLQWWPPDRLVYNEPPVFLWGIQEFGLFMTKKNKFSLIAGFFRTKLSTVYFTVVLSCNIVLQILRGNVFLMCICLSSRPPPKTVCVKT